MKTKMVYYYDMFNPGNVIKAENKLGINQYSMRYFLTKTGDMKDFCICNHAKFVNGVCINRTCRHTRDNHNPYCKGWIEK